MIRYIKQVIGSSKEISASIVRDGVDWHQHSSGENRGVC